MMPYSFARYTQLDGIIPGRLARENIILVVTISQ